MGRLLCYSPTGVIVASRASRTTHFAIGAGTDVVLTLESGDAVTYLLPSLERDRHRTDLGLWVGTAFDVASGSATHGPTWIVYGDRITCIYGADLGTVTEFESPIGRTQGACGVPNSGDVLVLADDGRMARVDPTTARAVGAWALPCARSGFNVASDGRTAWVSSGDQFGTFFAADISSRTPVRTVATKAAGCTTLALSADHRTLAVVTGHAGTAEGVATVTLYDVAGGAEREIARTEIIRHDAINGIAVFSKRRAVAIAGDATDSVIIEFQTPPDRSDESMVSGRYAGSGAR